MTSMAGNNELCRIRNPYDDNCIRTNESNETGERRWENVCFGYSICLFSSVQLASIIEFFF